MWNSIAAELLLLRRRTSTWVLLGLWVFLGILFNYIFPYIAYLDGGSSGFRQAPLSDMLPQRLVAVMSAGFPFYGGALVLVLGALTLGGEYGWGTLKTVFTQGPGRLRILTAKLIAVAIVLAVFVIAIFVAGAISSEIIALREGAATSWPSVGDFARAFITGWFILAVWTALGLMLGTLTRGVALAIGIGILYGLVIEGLLGAFADEISWLKPLGKVLIRGNAYSLVKPLGSLASPNATNGPGIFSGPFVSTGQAALVLGIYLLVFVGLTVALLRQRDIA